MEERAPHKCPGGCGRDVSYYLFACATCWRRVPHDLKRRILSAHADGRRGDHLRAMSEAAAHLAAVR